jgi:hypothetical protein
MDIDADLWNRLKPLAGRVFGSSLHFAMATVAEDGGPHVTPIGSLILTDPGEAYFFEILTRRLPANLDRGSPVCVLGVVSSLRLWVPSFVKGRFRVPPAFRLLGSAGERRAATPEECARWRRKVRWLEWTRGYRTLWSELETVRELQFDRLIPVEIGRMVPDVRSQQGWNG